MQERCALEAEIIRKCLSRNETQCSFVEYRCAVERAAPPIESKPHHPRPPPPPSSSPPPPPPRTNTTTAAAAAAIHHRAALHHDPTHTNIHPYSMTTEVTR